MRTGKWCIFRSTDQVDHAGETIRGLAAENKIVCAKVSTAFGRWYFDSHVICVYTKDWTNNEDLLATRKTLHEAGFVEELGYKRDIEMTQRIYGPHEWFKWG
ncbi:hypothetical protein D9M68_358930 [compost metagenome]